jgi:hypothetical protein
MGFFYAIFFAGQARRKFGKNRFSAAWLGESFHPIRTMKNPGLEQTLRALTPEQFNFSGDSVEAHW